jgi:8-oxo-dGTP pyrophosphatase MutT (NUDIX family)
VATKTKLRRAANASVSLPGATPHAGLGTVQFGQTGLKRSYGYVYEELLPQLAGRKAINVYQEMSQNSDVIGAVLFAIDMFMRKVAWRVEPASQSQADQQKAKFVSSCKDDMDHTWPEFISEINTMLPFGWSWFEIVYKQRKNKAIDEFGSAQSQWDDGLIGWKRFMPASQESWWRWDFDPSTGECIGMWQRPAPDYSERYLPLGKSLHFRTTSRKDNPEGVSVLRNAYRSWYFLKRMEEIEAIGAERDLAGIPFATVPAEMMAENASQDDINMVASIVKMVQNVRRDEQEGIVWPQAYDSAGNSLYEFKLLTTGGARQFQTDPIISRYQSRIAMTVLADFLLLGNDSTGNGSYALATSKASMFQSALETWLNEIENVLNNRAIPLLFRQNGINSGPYPKFRHDIVQKPTLTDLATLISSMAGAGAQLFPDADLENHLREFAELPIRESNPKDEATEDKIISQQLDTLLASSAAEQDMAQRTAQNATALGVVAAPEGAIVQRMDPVTLLPPAGGAPGAAGSPQAAPKTPAKGAAQAVATNRAAKTVGMGGKQKGSSPGAPTKSTGPVKSGSTVPKNRRTTISTRASQGAPPKATGGLKNRSVAKSNSSDQVLQHVKSQMSSNFPAFSMKWMKDARWTGPVLIPANLFDTSDEKTWAASHEPGKVREIKGKIKAGEMKPIVAVRTPGSNKLRIVDGHHHYFASRELGHPILAWVGTVGQNSGPWDDMHDYQMDTQNGKSSSATYKGGLKKSRSITGQAGGVAVKAADTGRVLMLQRGLNHEDPASGKWEFPGGRRESIRESPESAGIREWQEETGLPMPRGKYTGHWISKNGVYHGLVRTIPHEADLPIQTGRRKDANPDGDDIESLAWWDPDDLHHHPAIRPELAQNMKRVHKAIRSEEPLEVQKGKQSKASVHYRPGGVQKNCGNCFFFRKSDGDFQTGRCTKVVGVIAPEMLCDEFQPKSSGQPVRKLRAPRRQELVVPSAADRLAKSTNIVMHTVKSPVKKCDYCQKPEWKNWVDNTSGGIVARACQIHVPQARAEMRWTANNQVSPVNPNPYEPFPRAISL